MDHEIPLYGRKGQLCPKIDRDACDQAIFTLNRVIVLYGNVKHGKIYASVRFPIEGVRVRFKSVGPATTPNIVDIKCEHQN